MSKDQESSFETYLPALQLKEEDISLDKKYYFKVDEENISIFKKQGESYISLFLRSLTYCVLKPHYDSLEIDPAIFKKYKPDLLANDFTNDPVLWAMCFERDFEKIEYVCRHTPIETLVLIEISENIDVFIEKLKRKVHYKYHKMIKVLNYIPEIIYYVDPTDILVLEDWYYKYDLA